MSLLVSFKATIAWNREWDRKDSNLKHEKCPKLRCIFVYFGETDAMLTFYRERSQSGSRPGQATRPKDHMKIGIKTLPRHPKDKRWHQSHSRPAPVPPRSPSFHLCSSPFPQWATCPGAFTPLPLLFPLLGVLLPLLQKPSPGSPFSTQV